MSITVRLARPGDEPAIHDVHVTTWLAAYRGIIPDTHLNKLAHDHRFSFWLDGLGQAGHSTFIYLAEDGAGQVVGFAAAGPSRASHLPYAIELYALYVLPDQQGVGVGRALLNATARALRARGAPSMLLYVLKDNPSRHFYEGLGGQLLEERQIEIDGVTFSDVIYGWSNIASLIRDPRAAS